MTIDEVKERVKAIAVIAHDPESAHVLEDQLWEDVLECISANWSDNPRELAAQALMTRGIDFERWYA